MVIQGLQFNKFSSHTAAEEIIKVFDLNYMTMNRLENKVAIITGAASGIGLATAKLFHQHGAIVIAADIQEELLKEELTSLQDSGKIKTEKLDVSSEENWYRLVSDTMESFGRIDILINNAAIHSADAGILGTTLDSWNKLMSINSTGVFLGTKAVLPYLQKNGGGSIVNVASIAALVGGMNADAGAAAYSASKGSVRSLSRHTAQHFAKDKIRCNSIYPGGVLTPMMLKGLRDGGFSEEQVSGTGPIPLPPYVAEAIDIAYGILYLASDEAKYVTGAELVIDGGFVSQ